MTFSNCCIIAWYCKRFIEFTETIGFFPLPKPSSIGIRKYLLDYLVYVSTAAQCLVLFCYKYLQVLFCVKCAGRLFCNLKYWFFLPWKYFCLWWVEMQGYFRLISPGWIFFHASLCLQWFYQPVVIHCFHSFLRVKPI